MAGGRKVGDVVTWRDRRSVCAGGGGGGRGIVAGEEVVVGWWLERGEE